MGRHSAKLPLQVKSFSQSVPFIPSLHAHVYVASPLSVQVPPFWQGLGSHGVMRVSQSSPVCVTGQVHSYVSPPSISAQLPPFWQGDEEQARTKFSQLVPSYLSGQAQL